MSTVSNVTTDSDKTGIMPVRKPIELEIEYSATLQKAVWSGYREEKFHSIALMKIVKHLRKADEQFQNEGDPIFDESHASVLPKIASYQLATQLRIEGPFTDKTGYEVKSLPWIKIEEPFYLGPLEVGISCSDGRRDSMEDFYVACTIKGKNGAEIPLLCVLDGHRGHEAADYIQKVIKARVEEALSESIYEEKYASYPFLSPEHIYYALKTIPITLHEELLSRNIISGSMLNLMVCVDEYLCVVNVGDSRAVCLASESSGLQLTADKVFKKPFLDPVTSLFKNKLGGILHPKGGSYFFQGKYGQLNTEHALGNADIEGVNPQGTPTFYKGAFLATLQASDGLWRHVSSKKVLQLLSYWIQQDLDAPKIAENFVRFAKKEGSRDNVTVIVAFSKDIVD